MRAVAAVAGLSILGGLIIGGVRTADADREHRACLIVGEVEAKCRGLFPDIPDCLSEDCSDIRGPLGYWENDGRLWLTRPPWIITAGQGKS